jgi:transposase
MDTRQLKALEIAARCRLSFDGVAWSVPSQTSGGSYRVVLGGPDGRTCTCEDWTLRRLDCKHILAALLVAERDGTGKAPALDSDSAPQRKTYPQNWSIYNLAQTTEKHRFQELLFDLCQHLPAAGRKETGRKPIPWSDVVFACAFKVYSTISSRRFDGDLRDAHEKGYLTRKPHFNAINASLENPVPTPLLKGLIARSALPLRAIETDFAIDSSGFSVSRFVKWFDEKYGERSGKDWVKVPICTGVKTNVVAAIEIHGRDAADCPQFRPLLATTVKNFTVKEMSGDKAYSSLENVEAVDALGAFPAIAFKANASGASGGAFERLFFYYTYHREAFLATYHKRSNAESTFSMVKAKFRDNVRSRTDDAMTNEVLCKFLAHNICCVLMSQVELGIEAEFWPEVGRKEGEAAILPMKLNRAK